MISSLTGGSWGTKGDDSRLKLLLHLRELLLGHGTFTLTQLLELLPGGVKVWPGGCWRDLHGDSRGQTMMATTITRQKSYFQNNTNTHSHAHVDCTKYYSWSTIQDILHFLKGVLFCVDCLFLQSHSDSFLSKTGLLRVIAQLKMISYNIE